MIKTVIVLNDVIINVGEWKSTEPMPKGATIEKREMEYTDDYGWREIGYVPPQSELELLKHRLIIAENTILDLILGGL